MHTQDVVALIAMPERSDAQFDRLLSTKISFLLLAQAPLPPLLPLRPPNLSCDPHASLIDEGNQQGAEDVATRLLAEDILDKLVRGVKGASTRRLIDVFLQVIRCAVRIH